MNMNHDGKKVVEQFPHVYASSPLLKYHLFAL